MLQALSVAAADGAPPVVAQALEAMRGVADSLFRGCGLGHELFPDAVAALAAAARNPAAEELSVEAVWALQAVSQRLAEAPASVRIWLFLCKQSCQCHQGLERHMRT